MWISPWLQMRSFDQTVVSIQRKLNEAASWFGNLPLVKKCYWWRLSRSLFVFDCVVFSGTISPDSILGAPLQSIFLCDCGRWSYVSFVFYEFELATFVRRRASENKTVFLGVIRQSGFVCFSSVMKRLIHTKNKAYFFRTRMCEKYLESLYSVGCFFLGLIFLFETTSEQTQLWNLVLMNVHELIRSFLSRYGVLA